MKIRDSRQTQHNQNNTWTKIVSAYVCTQNYENILSLVKCECGEYLKNNRGCVTQDVETCERNSNVFQHKTRWVTDLRGKMLPVASFRVSLSNKRVDLKVGNIAEEYVKLNRVTSRIAKYQILNKTYLPTNDNINNATFGCTSLTSYEAWRQT